VWYVNLPKLGVATKLTSFDTEDGCQEMNLKVHVPLLWFKCGSPGKHIINQSGPRRSHVGAFLPLRSGQSARKGGQLFLSIRARRSTMSMASLARRASRIGGLTVSSVAARTSPAALPALPRR